MNKQGKIWGETELVFANQNTSIHYLEIKEGGYCSEHRHAQKLNHFYVITGELEISIWPDDSSLPDFTNLTAGQALTIPIGVWHRFLAVKRTTCIETYEVRFTGPDIKRRKEGGKE